MEISQQTIDFLVSMGMQVLAAIAILVVGWLIAATAERAVRKRSERSKVLDTTLAIVLAKITRALVLAVTLIAVLNQFGVQTTSLIALLGAAGQGLGQLVVGSPADICIYKPSEHWQVMPSALHSQSKHTPFAFDMNASQMPGEVQATLVAGRVAFELN